MAKTLPNAELQRIETATSTIVVPRVAKSDDFGARRAFQDSGKGFWNAVGVQDREASFWRRPFGFTRLGSISAKLNPGRSLLFANLEVRVGAARFDLKQHNLRR